jgi:ParB family chromosome partitioning protein
MLALGDHESRLLPIGALMEPPNPSRTTMDEQKLEELATSIRSLGVKSHLIVLAVDDRFEIIAGHRRYYAARAAGLREVPCDVYVDRERANEAVQHAENRFREDLTATDEAIWFDELLERKFSGDLDALCGFLGEKRSYVDDRIRLFRGDPLVFEQLQRGKIVMGVATQLNRCPDELHRRMLLDLAVKNGCTVAVASGWIQEWQDVHKYATRNLQPGAEAPSSSPAPLVDYFRCHLCDSKEHVSSMRPVQMHDFCMTTILAPALAMYQRRSDYLPMPRTVDEAVALVNELSERFPQLLEPEAEPRR